MRLIDADALKAEFTGNFHEMWHYTGIRAMIDIQPTVDAVEVVHGRWIATLVPDGYVQKASRLRKQCSVCGWTNACRYRFCPNCGAKMDGDGNA